MATCFAAPSGTRGTPRRPPGPAGDHAFSVLGAEEVFSIIRDNNLPSRRVAERNGMEIRGSLVKHYYGLDMPHLVYSIRRPEA